MRVSILSAAAFAAGALAAPQFAGAGFDPSALSGIGAAMGSMDFSGSTSNDLDNDPKCRPIYFIVARGSMEPGNVVSHHTHFTTTDNERWCTNMSPQGVTVGPQLCKGLRAKYKDQVGCQGIDPKGYSAGIIDNILPKGTADASIKTAVATFENAAQKCPSSIFVTEGYSQGAALIHNALTPLSDAIKQKIVAAVLFGDTKNKQSNAAIEGFPKDKTASFCAKDDGVCWGGLSVTAGHLAYLKNGDEQKAIDYMIGKIDAALAGKSAKERLVGQVNAKIDEALVGHDRVVGEA